MPYQSAPGLEDVVVGTTSVSYVGGETGELVLRGFPIQDLAGRVSYESVAALLLRGEFLEDEALAVFRNGLAKRRAPPASLEHVADSLPPSLPPIDVLRTLLSTLGEGSWRYPPTESQALDIIAQSPTLLARFVRRRNGRPPVAPDESLGHVENYLTMLLGTRPDPEKSQALEEYFILLADHGMNASTLSLRTVVSTQADLAAATTAAAAALKGPLHGGAPSRVSDMLDAVGREDRAPLWVRETLDRGERLMGFGHRAYKVEDPRAVILRGVAERVADRDRFRLARSVEREGLAQLHARRADQRLFTNVEFYGAVVLESVGLPRDMFTATFALARTAGWGAHALEQASSNRLIRPDVNYAGPRGLKLPENRSARQSSG